MRTRFIGAAVLAMTFTGGAAQAATLCVNPAVAGCHATIANAVAAAVENDVIKVAAGNYNERVVIATDGLQLIGAGIGRTIIDPSNPVVNTGAGIEITADRVVIQNLSLRFPDTDEAVLATGDFIKLSGMEAALSAADCVNITGDNAIVEKSRFQDCESVEIDGLSPIVRGNRFLRMDPGVDLVNADGALVERNLFERDQNNNGNVIGGSDVVFRNNTFFSSRGISVFGDRAVVQGNRMTAPSDALFVEGESPRVISNVILGTENDGIQVNCPTGGDCSAALVQGNRVYDVTDSGRALGVDFDEAGGRLIGNIVRGARGDDAIGIAGDGSVLAQGNIARANDNFQAIGVFDAGIKTLRSNQAIDCGFVGIAVLSAGTHFLEKNIAKKNTFAGILLDAGSTTPFLVGNIATDNFGVGIANYGMSTALQANIAKRNRQNFDYCGPAPGAPNTFGATSAMCPP